MKITEVRTRVVEWRGPTVPPLPHFCTNPMDLMQLPQDAMAGFRFHGWLIVEVFTDAGHVGIGEAALAPRLTKQTIDIYLKPLLLGTDPFDIEYLWQLMYRKTMAFGRKGVGMTAISAVDIVRRTAPESSRAVAAPTACATGMASPIEVIVPTHVAPVTTCA